MLSRLGVYADRVIEWGWLLAAVFAPLYFNVYSSRVFEPDKITLLRSLVVLMTVAWLIKLFEGGYRSWQASDSETRGGRLVDAARGASERGLPSWLGFLRVPMIVPILVYALAYLLSSIFTVTPDATWWGSYQRLQGTYSQYSYMMLGILVIANMRTRVQLERLISFMILTSVPVALYGLVQAARLDPLPWAGDVATRVASTMGNAIFVAAWLIMVVPLTLYRFLNGLSESLSKPEAAPNQAASGRGRALARSRVLEEPGYGWAVIANGVGVLITLMLLFMLVLKLVSGLPYLDARLWPLIPLALLLFYLGGWFFEWLGRRADDPAQVSRIMPAVGVALFFLAFLALPFSWSLDRTPNDRGQPSMAILVGFDGAGVLWSLVAIFLWLTVAAGAYLVAYLFSKRDDRDGEPMPAGALMVYAGSIVVNTVLLFIHLLATTSLIVALLWSLFYVLLWGAVTAGVSALLGGERVYGAGEPDRVLLRWALVGGYGLLLVLQLVCIYLTQSRGPWIGLGMGLVTFAVALWLVGRRRGVRWMARIGGAVSAVTLALALFVGALNIPGSPLQAMSGLPVLGRGIERLSTIARTEDGTGKVRTLIWEGATNLILSDPVRAIIGWGPEAMYVAYSRFYPAELAHWELRNATPDRSHNVEFDQLVTMGVVGLAAYYFLVAAFYFYGIRTLKRTKSVRDQLLVIGLLSAMSAHFIEIQTGIQIAATWTYFYLLIGMMAAFGWYVTGHIRGEAAPEEVAVMYVGGDGALPEAVEVTQPAMTVGAAQTSAGRRSRAQATAAVASGDGRGAGSPPQAKKKSAGARGASPQPETRSKASTQVQGSRRRQGQAYPVYGREWLRSPLMVVLYVALGLAALVFIASVNVASVRADTYYKQGLAHDGRQLWWQSIGLYQEAINTQPNQDYYYLFLGRAWLEFAKQVGNETDERGQPINLNFRTRQPYKDEAEKRTEKLLRLQQAESVLKHARDINPLNTDHYANLGRLYLYWGDASGGGDPSKAPLAVQYLQGAVERTPGNAQLWDELAVAYARNGQFDEAMETLDHSQHNVDPRYARTPFIRGQLLQERALNVKDALINGRSLPQEGEIDYGKLVLETGRAFSETIGIDQAQFLDSNYQGRVDFLLNATKPFTNNNTTLAPEVFNNVLTSTVMLALELQLPQRERALADYLRERGAFRSGENVVPNELLQSLGQDPQWVGLNEKDGRVWLDPTLVGLTHNAALPHAALGYIYAKVGRQERAVESYQRALTLEPSNETWQQELQALTQP